MLAQTIRAANFGAYEAVTLAHAAVATVLGAAAIVIGALAAKNPSRRFAAGIGVGMGIALLTAVLSTALFSLASFLPS